MRRPLKCECPSTDFCNHQPDECTNEGQPDYSRAKWGNDDLRIMCSGCLNHEEKAEEQGYFQ